MIVKSRLIIFAADLADSMSCEPLTPTAINSTLVYLFAKKATSAESIPPEKETVTPPHYHSGQHFLMQSIYLI